MAENPHPNGVLRSEDVDHALGRLQQEYGRPLLRRRSTLNTSNDTVQDTLKESVHKMADRCTDADRVTMLLNRKWREGGDLLK